MPAWADKRVALVIGVDTYDNLDPRAQLKKARADAVAVARALQAVGFEVIQRNDLKRSAFNEVWQEFLNRLEPGDSAAFYFSGHGVELNRQNYLLPSDIPNVKPGRDELLKRESLSLQEFLADLREKGTRFNLVILDACRDNPFAQSGKKSIGSERGLATMAEPPAGTFIMYSAGSGESALDRLSDADANPNSVYTRLLLPLIATKGLSLNDVAEQVREGVRETAARVQHSQTPSFYNQLVGRKKVCLAGCEVASATVPIVPPTASKLDGIMTRCVLNPSHPAASEIAFRVAKELLPQKFSYAWRESRGTDIETIFDNIKGYKKDVISVESAEEDLKISYDWQHGYLRLRPVAPREVATRGISAPDASDDSVSGESRLASSGFDPSGKSGSRPGKQGVRFEGIWVQDNGYGCVRLLIAPDGEGEGKWGIKTGPLDSDVYLKRKN